jgi:hypothetical protein
MDAFGIRKHSTNGISTRCKECVNALQQEYKRSRALVDVTEPEEQDIEALAAPIEWRPMGPPAL